MKNIIIILLLAIGLQLSAQNPLILSKTDKPEYANYLYWCNLQVADTAEQWGKVTIVRRVIVKNDILLWSGDTVKAGTISYTFKDPLDTVWFDYFKRDYKTNSTKPAARHRAYYYEPNEMTLIRQKAYRIPQRKPSVKDFYQYWQTHLIP